MDLNYSFGTTGNSHGKANLVPQSQSPSVNGTPLWTGNYPSAQQLHQINAQIGTLNLTDTGTNYLDALLVLSQGFGSPQSPPIGGPFLIPSIQPPFYNFPPLLPNPYIPYTPMMSQEQLSENVGIDQSSVDLSSSVPNNTGYSDTPFSSQQPLQTVETQNLPTLIGSYGAIPRAITAKLERQNSELQEKQLNQSTIDIVSHPRQRAALETVHISSAPSKQSPVKLNVSKSLADESTNSSTPVSPGTQEYSIEFSDSGSSGTISPTSPRSPFINGDFIGRSPLSPTLSYRQRFPQDQCFRCSKKVYPMEKLGPVKDVVYHKGCFQCRVCHTRLNIKNFFFNRNDLNDLHAYCKSHQPEAAGKAGKIDSDSVQIKGAINVPKLNKVNEQIRGDENTGKYDTMDVEAPKSTVTENDQLKAIEMKTIQATHVSSVDLQPQNTVQDESRTKEERPHDPEHPGDVVLSPTNITELNNANIMNEHNHNTDNDIIQATHVHTVNSHVGNNVQNQSWTKEVRSPEPPDVTPQEEPAPDYDLSELDPIDVEFYPEYDYDVATNTYILRREDMQ